MSDDSKSVVEFPTGDGEPSIRRAPKQGNFQRSCIYHGQLLIDEDTQLVTCKRCGVVMSAYNALMNLVKHWERMHYDTTDWKKMKAEQAKEPKRKQVRRRVRELQWIECPEEGDEPARTYWLKLTEAMGHEPYALFRRGRAKNPIQYCVLSQPVGSGGWTDADSMINHYEASKRTDVKKMPERRESA